MIHPTAIIDPSAQIGAHVKIGPFTIVHPDVVIGNSCELHSNVVIYPGTTLGEANVVHAGAVLGGDPQDVNFPQETISHVVLGDRNVIREHVTIHRSAKESGVTRIGDDCFLMVGTHIGHDSTLGNRVILANDVMLGGHVSVGDSVFMGGGTGVHQHVRVGRLVMTQGHSSISKDVPPFTVTSDLNLVAGLNTIGLRRGNISSEARAEIKAAFSLIYRSGLNVTQALEAADTRPWGPEAMEFFEFIRGAKARGICALAK